MHQHIANPRNRWANPGVFQRLFLNRLERFLCIPPTPASPRQPTVRAQRAAPRLHGAGRGEAQGDCPRTPVLAGENSRNFSRARGGTAHHPDPQPGQLHDPIQAGPLEAGRRKRLPPLPTQRKGGGAETRGAGGQPRSPLLAALLALTAQTRPPDRTRVSGQRAAPHRLLAAREPDDGQTAAVAAGSLFYLAWQV